MSIAKLRSQEWLYGEGLKLPVEMIYDTALARDAYSLAERWDASRHEADVSKLSFSEEDTASFNANQKGMHRLMAFISHAGSPVTPHSGLP